MSVQTVIHAAHAELSVLAAAPPAGGGGFDTGGGGATLPGNLHASAQTIIYWMCGVVAVVAVLGGLGAAASMIAARSGHGQAPEGVHKLGWVFGGLLTASVVGAAVNTIYA